MKHEERLRVVITKKGVIFEEVPEDNCDIDCVDHCLYFPVSLQELQAMHKFCHSQQSCFRNPHFLNTEMYFKLKKKINNQAIIKRKLILLEKNNVIVL